MVAVFSNQKETFQLQNANKFPKVERDDARHPRNRLIGRDRNMKKRVADDSISPESFATALETGFHNYAIESTPACGLFEK